MVRHSPDDGTGCATQLAQALMVAVVAVVAGFVSYWLLLAVAPADGDPLPTDPFQRTATRALRGDFGTLQPWQREGYQRGLKQGVTASRVLVVTQYNHGERSGHWDGHSQHCTLRTAASNHIPQYSLVWTEQTGLRTVLDTGARSNDRKAARLGGTWVDVWYPSAAEARAAGIDGWRVLRGAVIAR